MRINSNQLSEQLLKSEAQLYLITGDEPLQMAEAGDSVRQYARKQGYQNREIYNIEPQFQWRELLANCQTQSIFSDKKFIDIRLSSPSIGRDGASAMIQLCRLNQNDNFVLISADKFKKATLQSQWVKAVDQAGMIVQVWPIEPKNLFDWLRQRARKKGLNIADDALRLFAARVEGNLLAAVQELEKLHVLHGDDTINMQMIEAFVANSSRFNVFELTESALAGRMNRTMVILSSLRAETTPTAVILWALANELRLLLRLKKGMEQGQNIAQLFKKFAVWNKKAPLIKSALQRLSSEQLENMLVLAAFADQQIKGQRSGDCWDSLSTLCESFCCAETWLLDFEI